MYRAMLRKASGTYSPVHHQVHVRLEEYGLRGLYPTEPVGGHGRPEDMVPCDPPDAGYPCIEKEQR